LQEVQAVCDRVIIIDTGRKVVDQRLDELQRGARLLLELDAGPEQASPVLDRLDAVAALQAEQAGERWRYALQADEQAAPRIAAAVQQAGFALYALYPERRDLETLFAEVSGSQPREVAHAA
jgi:ABC-2 type transport system ATP-binding protein